LDFKPIQKTPFVAKLEIPKSIQKPSFQQKVNKPITYINEYHRSRPGRGMVSGADIAKPFVNLAKKPLEKLYDTFVTPEVIDEEYVSKHTYDKQQFFHFLGIDDN